MVFCHLAITLDGFIAGREHDMAFFRSVEQTPDFAARYAPKSGAVLAGRRWCDAHGRPESR